MLINLKNSVFRRNFFLIIIVIWNSSKSSIVFFYLDVFEAIQNTDLFVLMHLNCICSFFKGPQLMTSREYLKTLRLTLLHNVRLSGCKASAT